ncbi:Mg2+ transporter MgtE [Entomoplasma freundtii]|uniref:Magnesium transporter MgtE n=1 Tax=Entomoplasma freundtii TaxID=74700 RepID=A0A2K8NS99_9MOLU|nr:magnesium transporter [Entomoplasma freundtii]ATZ16647.1 Mg2+ transport protein [Entomoplasma freundtii]TDY58186.1 Mg2+ transporter MgtE [Entomoplasma freundtii]
MLEIPEIQQRILHALDSGDSQEVKKVIKKVQLADIAEAICELPITKIIHFFRLLTPQYGAQIIPYLSNACQKKVISGLNAPELKTFIDKMYSDDLVDLLDKLSPRLATKVLAATSPKRRVELNNILRHEEESAGGMMSVNFVQAKEKDTVNKTIKYLRENHKDFEFVNTLFIVDEYGFYKGRLELKTIFFAPSTAKLSEIMDSRQLTVHSRADREQVISIFQKYDISILPVLDDQKKIVGFITVDDVLDGVEEESTEDIAKLAGIRPKDEEFFNISVWKMFKSRILWLISMLVLGTISQILVILFWNAYHVPNVNNVTDGKAFAAVVLFAPMMLILAGIGGISATQSSTVMVRAISINKVHKKDVYKVLGKETLVALWTGLILVVINIIRLILVYLVEFDDVESLALWKAIAVSSITLLLGLVIGNVLATLLPILAKAMKLDPTLACGPLITTLLDIIIVSLLFGFGLAFF